jgi:hypothetical protein
VSRDGIVVFLPRLKAVWLASQAEVIVDRHGFGHRAESMIAQVYIIDYERFAPPCQE